MKYLSKTSSLVEDLVRQIRFWLTDLSDSGCRQFQTQYGADLARGVTGWVSTEKEAPCIWLGASLGTAIVRPEYLKACERRSALNCCLRVRRRVFRARL